ncbi:MAG: glycosyltransferase [bacterium]
MKIAQFIASDGWGGAEKVFVNLCNALAQEHEVTALIYDNPVLVRNLDHRVRQILLPHTSRYNPCFFWHLYRLLKTRRFDIVHTHCAKATEIVYQLSRFQPLCQVATKHNPRKGAIFEKVRHVTAVSLSTARTVQRGATVIYNGIVPLAITPGDERHSPISMLAIGRLDPIKGFDHLIEQTARLKLDFRLEIIGDGPQREMLQRQIDEAHLNEKIKLAGYCENIPERMRDADLVIISSHSEGFPLVLAESFFYAKVLISTPVSDVTEILNAALWAEQEHLAEKITEVAGEYVTYRALFRAVQEANRERFRIETVAKSYVAFYGALCA